eukprot:CAMPEP_0171242530 /NCGR_PEP_ID=MMETSP0790-20130122/45752_1 /TAXON_ID=2925 /ORGANISM="Alexandrium catenella, Strain OF101" /LENGTH=357 /DNA_ID=CAMNT_0011709361 /DNA_START=58 /DNA_END=1131 /DNA_ORIENTATION=-
MASMGLLGTAQAYGAAGNGAPMGIGFNGYSGQGYNGYSGQSAGYDTLASIPIEKHSSNRLGIPDVMRKPFLTGQRRRLNVIPVLVCWFLPWGLFIFDYWVSSFPVRYEMPWVFDLAMVASALVVFAFIVTAVTNRLKLFARSDRDPSWLIFLALFMTVALVGGAFLGNRSYKKYMRPYLDFNNLNSYTDIYPNLMRGQQLMDAGVVLFAPGTRIDVSLSEGFKDGTQYCVAPIAFSNATPPTYDFWAVGTNCCSGTKPDFRCEGWNSEKYGGLRLMDSHARGFYRLAVEQAEATYKIKAAHPLFFTWTRKPLQTVEGWEKTVRSNFILWIFGYGLFQAFCVVAATLAFSRTGNLSNL